MLNLNNVNSNNSITTSVVDNFKFRACFDFSGYLQKINNIPCLTKDEEFMLAKSYLEKHDIKAAHKLVASHLKLVAKIAMQYKNYGLPIAELVSEGNIGLMQAVKKYDPDLGYRLSTYAMWWIKAAIQEYVLKSWSLVKIGTTAAQKKLFFSLSKIKKKLSKLYSRSINASDHQKIAEDLGVSVKDVNEMSQRLAGPDMSLNRAIDHNDDNSAEMIDFIPTSQLSQEEILSKRESIMYQKRILESALQILNTREASILSARKLADEPSTLEVLSHKYDISKERVRQIESKAFEKVKLYILNKMQSNGALYTLTTI